MAVCAFVAFPCIPSTVAAQAQQSPANDAAGAAKDGADTSKDGTAGTAQGGGAPARQEPPPPTQAQDSIVLANGKVRLGATFYADWAYYAKTGFGPQFVTQTNFPGPENDSFNAFDVHRAYLNFFF